jgi:hypothetical protein
MRLTAPRFVGISKRARVHAGGSMHALKLLLNLLAFLSAHTRSLEGPCMRLSCSLICWHFLACTHARWRVHACA